MAQDKFQFKLTNCFDAKLLNSSCSCRIREPIKKINHATFHLVVQIGILIFIISSHGFAQSIGSQDKLHFLLSFGAQTNSTCDRKLISVVNGMVLHSGDLLKFFIEAKTNSYFYLAHHNPNGTLTILYPDIFPSKKTNPSNSFFVPEGTLWFEMDNTNGMEKFFFLASKDRLKRLEDLCARHITYKDPYALQVSTGSILSEISRLSKQNRSLAAPAERPAFIAGAQRDVQTKDSTMLMDITPFAKEIQATNFYSQTFTIDHQ